MNSRTRGEIKNQLMVLLASFTLEDIQTVLTELDEEQASVEQSKPELKLVNEDGNAFSVLGRAQKVARKAGWTEEKIDDFMREAKSGTYDHLLQTCMKYFDVT